MLKEPITYEDGNGNTVTEDFYFHLSQADLIELEVEYKQGFSEMLQEIIKEEDRKELIKTFKKIVLLAYGVKSEDGKQFEKSDELRKQFGNSFAYPVLFMQLATDDKKASDFIKGIMPRELAAEIEKAELQAGVAANLTKVPDAEPEVPPTT